MKIREAIARKESQTMESIGESTSLLERSKIALDCLPDAPYRDMLAQLHADMLGAHAQPNKQDRSVEREALIGKMIDRFLGWPMPKDFAPDCGIDFDGRKDDDWNKNKTWPIGTNLLTADQARAMITHMLAADAPPLRTQIPSDIGDQLMRADWTRKEALEFYAAGKHYDIPHGRTRILDTGAIASNALKSIDLEYSAKHGDVALLAADAQQVPAKSALERFKTLLLDEDQESPLERLRFFCSLAMNGQDWLDVERFFDDLAAQQVPMTRNEINDVVLTVCDKLYPSLYPSAPAGSFSNVDAAFYSAFARAIEAHHHIGVKP